MFLFLSLFFCFHLCLIETIYLLVGYNKAQFIIHCPESSTYKNEQVEHLKTVLKHLTNAKDEDILLSGVRKGSIIVIFLIKSDIIPQIRHLFISECHKILQRLNLNITKVLIDDEVIYTSGMLFTFFYSNSNNSKKRLPFLLSILFLLRQVAKD